MMQELTPAEREAIVMYMQGEALAAYGDSTEVGLSLLAYAYKSLLLTDSIPDLRMSDEEIAALNRHMEDTKK